MRASARDYFAPRTKVSGTPPREGSPLLRRWSSLAPPVGRRWRRPRRQQASARRSRARYRAGSYGGSGV